MTTTGRIPACCLNEWIDSDPFAEFVQSFAEYVLTEHVREGRHLYHFTKINLNNMIGKAKNACPVKLLRKSWRQFGKASLIKPKSILWLEPLALLLLFGLLLALVLLALS